MSIARFSVKNPVLINLLMILVFISGLYVINTIPKEEMPAVDFGLFVINVSYPGVSPEEIETEIVDKIEKEISDVDDIDDITSTSTEGFATIRVEMNEKADLDETWNDLNTELDKVKDLPTDANDPVITRINMREVNSICSLVLSGDYDENTLRELTEDLQDDILEIDNISKVEVAGTREREIVVDVDKEKLSGYGLSLNQVSAAITARNINAPAGNIYYDDEEYILRTLGEYKEISEISATIIKTDGSGNALRVRDIATVKDTLEESSTIGRLDGVQGTTLSVYKKADGNIITVVEEIKELITEYKEKIPNLIIELRNDGSLDVSRSMSTLSSNAILGIILVFFVLWIFIGWKNALFASWGIPFSIFLTFILMQYFDVTINNLSLFGLILVLGMIVDDAIIVLENIQRYREQGLGMKEATIKGAEEIMWPVIAAVATTISAFLPLLFMTGQMGKFLSLFPIVVSLALLASLIECLIVLPSHVAELGVSKRKKDNEANWISRYLAKKYERAVRWALSHRVAMVGFLFLSLFFTGAVVAGGLIKFEFFPKQSPKTIVLNLKAPTGTKLEQTTEVVSSIENFIFQMEEKTDVESVISNVGQLQENHQTQTKKHYAEVKIDFIDQDDMTYTHTEIKNKIRAFIDKIPNIDSYTFKDGGQGGPPTGDDIELRIKGEDYDILEQINERVIEELENIPGVTEIESSLNDGKEEIRIIPLYDIMEMYGISTQDIANVTRIASYGSTITEYRGSGQDEIDITLKVQDSQIEEFEELKDLKLQTSNGSMISLKELVEFSFETGYSEVQHYNKERYVNLTASVTSYNQDGKVLAQSSNFVNRKLRDDDGIVNELKREYPNYEIEFGGVAQQQNETYGSLFFAFGIAILLIYTILAAQFKSYVQPFIVMMAIPFAIVGVVFGLLVTRLPLSMTTMIAFVALAGIVVNDSLVLVDFVNKQREQGVDRWNSLINAGMIRLRPILMTTVTTIAGFLPMILSTSSATSDWKPMAVCMAFGLGFATVLTLFVIPVIYTFIDSFFGKLKLTRFGSHVSFEEAMKLRDEK